MGNEERRRPIQVLKNLAFALERVVAEEAAEGAVRGAADGLRAELPEVDVQVRALLADSLTALGRLAHHAATTAPADPGQVAHDLAVSVSRGVLDELERQWLEGGLPLHALIERVNKGLDAIYRYSESKRALWEHPDQRAREMAEGAVAGAADRLHELTPRMTEDLGPLGGEVARQVGRGLYEGVTRAARKDTPIARQFLEDAGRAMARGFFAAAGEEVGRRLAKLDPEVMGAAAARVFERAAEAAVRGAVSAIGEGLRPLGRQLGRDGGQALRTATRQATAGVLDAFAALLRKPRVAAGAGVGGLVLLAAGAAALRRR